VRFFRFLCGWWGERNPVRIDVRKTSVHGLQIAYTVNGLSTVNSVNGLGTVNTVAGVL